MICGQKSLLGALFYCVFVLLTVAYGSGVEQVKPYDLHPTYNTHVFFARLHRTAGVHFRELIDHSGWASHYKLVDAPWGFAHCRMRDGCAPDGAFLLASLRDPITRVPSHYDMVLAMTNNRTRKSVCKGKGTFEEFIFTCNLFTSDLQHRGMLYENDEKTEEIINRFNFVLLQERFDESMLLLSLMVPWIRGADLLPVLPALSRAGDAKTTTSNMTEYIVKQNRNDAQLHHYANIRMDLTIEMIGKPLFTAALSRLRELQHAASKKCEDPRGKVSMKLQFSEERKACTETFCAAQDCDFRGWICSDVAREQVGADRIPEFCTLQSVNTSAFVSLGDAIVLQNTWQAEPEEPISQGEQEDELIDFEMGFEEPPSVERSNHIWFLLPPVCFLAYLPFAYKHGKLSV